LAFLKRNVCNAQRSKYGRPMCSYDGIDAIKHGVL